MKNIKYDVEHKYQPTNNTCGYAALAIFLSHHNKDFRPEELLAKVPQPNDSDGTPQGSVTAQLANWCQTQGYQIHMYVSDLYILDLSWKNKNSQQILERLKQVKSKRDIPIMDKHWVSVYEDAYISMLENGADISIRPFITTKLVNRLLKKSPVYANICSTALRGKGRDISSVDNGKRKRNLNDVDGSIGNHSVVIYGADSKGNYLVADPWDGLIKVEPETLVLSIEAAQIECDNQIFVVEA